MSVTAESVAVEIIAKLNGAEAEIKRLDTTFSGSTSSMKRSAKDLETAIARVDSSSVTSFKRVGEAATKAANDVERSSRLSANATRNLGRQVADVGTQLSSGSSPFLIFSQQAPQVADALADTGGRAAKVAAFFAGPWGAAILGAVSVLGMLAPRLLDTSDATSQLSDEQIDLATYVDRATGALNRQRTAVERLAAAQARQSDIEKGTRDYVSARGSAFRAVNEAAGRREPTFIAGVQLPNEATRDPVKLRLRELAAEAVRTKQPINDFALAVRQAVGDRPEYRALVKTITSQSAAAIDAARNVQRLKAEQAVLTGTATAQQKAMLGLGQATTSLIEKQVGLATATSTLERARAKLALVEEQGRNVQTGDARALAKYRFDLTAATNAVKAAEAAEKAAGDAKRRSTAASREAAQQERERVKALREAARAERELISLRSDYAGARADLTSDTRLQDEFARERINLDRRGRSIDLDERRDRGDLSAAEYDERKKLVDAIADARLDLVNRNESIRTANEGLEAARASSANRRDLLEAEASLATTTAERKRIAIALLDLAIEEQRLSAQKVIDLAAEGKASEEEAAIARGRLEALPLLKSAGREGIERDSRGPLADYQAELQRASQEIDRAFEAVAVDGLTALNDGIAQAITGAGSLGDVFSKVADRIIADLIRIAIQEVIIRPLLQALGGGSGGGAGAGGGAEAALGSLIINGIGALFGGGRASGGPVEAGRIYRVNEGASPGRVEGFRPAGSGTIIPLGQMNAIRPSGDGTRIFNINVDASNSVTPAGFARELSAAILSQADSMDQGRQRQTLARVPAAGAFTRKYGVTPQ